MNQHKLFLEIKSLKAFLSQYYPYRNNLELYTRIEEIEMQQSKSIKICRNWLKKQSNPAYKGCQFNGRCFYKHSFHRRCKYDVIGCNGYLSGKCKYSHYNSLQFHNSIFNKQNNNSNHTINNNHNQIISNNNNMVQTGLSNKGNINLNGFPIITNKNNNNNNQSNFNINGTFTGKPLLSTQLPSNIAPLGNNSINGNVINNNVSMDNKGIINKELKLDDIDLNESDDSDNLLPTSNNNNKHINTRNRSKFYSIDVSNMNTSIVQDTNNNNNNNNGNKENTVVDNNNNNENSSQVNENKTNSKRKDNINDKDEIKSNNNKSQKKKENQMSNDESNENESKRSQSPKTNSNDNNNKLKQMRKNKHYVCNKCNTPYLRGKNGLCTDCFVDNELDENKNETHINRFEEIGTNIDLIHESEFKRLNSTRRKKAFLKKHPSFYKNTKRLGLSIVIL